MMVFANAGLPMIVVGLPIMIAALAPIVLIEGAWYWRFLQLPWRLAWRASLLANLWSTCIGLPVAWIVWVVIGQASAGLVASSGLISPQQAQQSYLLGFFCLVVQSGWLYPNENMGEILVLGAGMVLLLPCYLVSYIGEARYLQRFWPESDAKEVYRRVWQAHLVTYGLLYLIAGCRYYWLTHGGS